MRLRFVAVGAGLVLTIIAWFFVLFKPASSKLEEVKKEITTTETQIAALRAKLAELQELQRNEEELREQAATFAKALPQKPELSTFVRQVHKIAVESDVRWVSVSPGTPSAAPGAAPAAPAPDGTTPAAPASLSTIGVSMAANGGFFALERFVEKFERLDRAVRIDNFSISGAAGDLSLAISMKMFMGGVTAASLAAVPPAPAPGAAAPASPAADPAP